MSGDAIREGEGLFLIVGDEEEGDADAALEALEFGADLFAEVGVEGGEGLVEEEDFGLEDEGAGEGDALFFAAGEFGGEAVGLAGADQFEHLFTLARMRRGLTHAAVRGRTRCSGATVRWGKRA